MVEIAPGVHSIPSGDGGFMGLYGPNVYLVAGERAALVDSGYEDSGLVESRLEHIEGLAPLKLAYILLTHTHPDHIGGCAGIREATGAAIAVHLLGAARLERHGVSADVIVGEGDILDLGGVRLEVIHTPGHTRDSVCYYIEESGVLFAGDHIVGFGTPVIDAPDGDIGAYLGSLKRLLGYRLSLICPGHGPLVREPERKIRELIAHREEREQQIISCLSRGTMSVAGLIAEIYPELDSRLVVLARRQVVAHLNKLVVEGRALGSGEDYTLTGP